MTFLTTNSGCRGRLHRLARNRLLISFVVQRFAESPAHRCPKLRMTAVADSAGLSSSAGAAAQGRSFSYENLMGKALDTGQIVYMDAHWVFACFSPRQERRRETPYKPRELAGQPLLARKTDLHRYDLSLKNCATLR